MLGVRIAMDDFGTGYSSLSNLRAFPFDKIKIDGSFIKSVNSTTRVPRSCARCSGSAARLLVVLAEGVETAAEFDFLKTENCNEVQGYLLGRPADIESLPPDSPDGADDVAEQSTVVPLATKTSSG